MLGADSLNQTAPNRLQATEAPDYRKTVAEAQGVKFIKTQEETNKNDR